MNSHQWIVLNMEVDLTVAGLHVCAGFLFCVPGFFCRSFVVACVLLSVFFGAVAVEEVYVI